MGKIPLEAFVLLGSAIGTAIAASEPPRPRGVGPDFAKFYNSPEIFTCISNPSVTLPVTRINDDFCDCPDGSDEPGTSACSHLSPLSPAFPSFVQDDGLNTTIALPGYYCKNKGHKPTYIPFTYVNDGVCDYELCCDGSDEWASVGGIRCEDRCKEVGKEWRRQDEARQRALGAAGKRRKELVEEARRLRKEVEDRIMTLGTQIEGLQLKVANEAKELAEIERREKGRVVKEKGKGKVGVFIGLARERINELRDNLEWVRGERNQYRERLVELEGILATFKDEYNPNFNDEGVKRAVRGWEDYAAREKGPEHDTGYERDLDEMLKSDSENGINWDEWQEDAGSDVDVLYQFEMYLPKQLRDWIDQKLRDLRAVLIESGILASNNVDGNESKAVADTRNRLDTAQSDLQGTQSSLQTHKEDLEKDYGPDDVFRALKGQCISQDSGEYVYELCWMDKATQKSKKGGAQTGMGNFVRIERVTVDEELPLDGKGLGTGERFALKYENGQHCWNGPNRSTTVILACAEKDEIWKVVEEEKCVYRMEVGTPAACGAAGQSKGAPARDEL